MSFGAVKNVTALGGAVVFFKDSNIHQDIQKHLQTYHQVSEREYLFKVFKYFGLWILQKPIIFSIIYRYIQFKNKSFDDFILSLVRGFSSDDFFKQIRRKPSICHKHFIEKKIFKDQAWQIHFFNKLNTAVDFVNEQLNVNNFNREQIDLGQKETARIWLYPVIVDQPLELQKRLMQAGFDAACKTNLSVLNPDVCPGAKRLMDKACFIPVYSMPKKRLQKLCAEILDV